MKKEVLEKIEEMASVNEPFELFEPYIWKDKIGDSLWHCQMRSADAVLADGQGETIEDAVNKCYSQMKGWS